MKRYLYLIFIGTLLSFTSCSIDDPFADNDRYNPNQNTGLQFIGMPMDFDTHNVATRAENGVSDSYISEMTMLIFKKDGNMLEAVGADQQPLKSSHITIYRSNPTFLIEANKYEGTGIIASMEDGVTSKYFDNTATDLDACQIYIVANCYHLLGERLENGEIQTLDDLKSALLDADITLDIPKSGEEYVGLPMIGYAKKADETAATFDLQYKAAGIDKENAVATIPLKKLYSKVYFRMQVNSNQLVTGGQTPSFKIDRAEVFNVPSKVRMDVARGTDQNTMDYMSVEGVAGLTAKDAYNYLFDPNPAPQTVQNPFVINTFNKKTIYHSSSSTTDDYIEFVFYMPEHKVIPYEITYPFAKDSDEFNNYAQYYKPKGVGLGSETGVGTYKIASFVRIHGTYTDHHAQIYNVSYDIYLGQNNSDNYEIKRNQQLNNYLTITGLTNHKDAYPDSQGNISIDHRVSMSDLGYNLSIEREAILDAHFEVRPLDVELAPGGQMTLIIPEADRGWLSMELDAFELKDRPGVTFNPNLYVNTTQARRGVRKYFTTNLVSELNNNNKGTITLKHSGTAGQKEIYRIWLYIDENPNVYDKTGNGKQTSESGSYTVSKNLYRLGKINVYFKKDGEPNTDGTPSAVLNMQQWNLWRVWNSTGTRFYDIEHEEEYLNNYASDQGYGQTEDGMPWGLDGVQLSYLHDAAYLDYTPTGIIQRILSLIGWEYEELVNQALKERNIKYDYYLDRDVANDNQLKQHAVVRNYSGYEFNAEIISKLQEMFSVSNDVELKKKIQVEGLSLIDTPQSAIAYCYHKNKRDADGNVATVNWYLPAIDEIEDIAKGAYDEFNKVFQNQKYWSCQPAFNPVLIDLDIWRWGLNNWQLTWYDTGDDAEGLYYFDNISRARSTSVVAKDGVFQNVISSSSDLFGTQTGQLRVNTGVEFRYNDITKHEPLYTNHPGNLLRTENCRIRAVYRSGMK